MKVLIPRREGYWYSKFAPFYPVPMAGTKPWVGKTEFMKALRVLQGKFGVESRSYKGSSTCRICGQINGSSDFRWKNWVWPSGYYHYIKEHNVRPSLAFQEFVLGRVLSSD